MNQAKVLQGVRQMRFEGLLERHERGELSQGEAAEMLGVSERKFRRWRDRLRDEGPQGLRDRRIGKPSSRRMAAEEISRPYRFPPSQTAEVGSVGTSSAAAAACGQVGCADNATRHRTRGLLRKS
jgi:predicted DNA-binding transcriptional regulator YafY